MSIKPTCLVICGDGVNCENETAYAFNQFGADAKIAHINELINGSIKVNDFQILVFPGGFSFGDELGSGQILALKAQRFLAESLEKFVEAKRPVIGICNGFQALTKLKLISVEPQKQDIALARNRDQRFINRWVGLKVNLNNQSL